MPSGKTHALITTITATGIPYIASKYTAMSSEQLLAIACGCLAGIFVTPDLDVDDHPISSQYQMRRTSWLLYAIWRFVWWPYSRLIKHRSWISHAPFISTFLRVGYILIWVWPILAIIQKDPWPLLSIPAWALWALVGLLVSDLLHWLADITL